MTTSAHIRIADQLQELSTPPTGEIAFNEWLSADGPLRLLEDIAGGDEQILLACGPFPFAFIKAVLVPATSLDPVDHTDLLSWSCEPVRGVAEYEMPAGRTGLSVTQAEFVSGSMSLEGATPLAFYRHFEGVADPSSESVQLLQRFEHVLDIVWMPDRNAYCHINRLGDYIAIVSASNTGDMRLVTCRRCFLDEYLIATDSVMVLLFDFDMRRGRPPIWSSDTPDAIHTTNDTLFYRQRITESHASLTRGAQIIRPRLTRQQAIKAVRDRWCGFRDHEGVELWIHDWRHAQVRKVSTARGGTTDYSKGEKGVAFEMSAAFFRPEVLLKYRSDVDKYTVEDRTIRCRGAWELRGYGANDAGQVFAYVRYLKSLPFEEQQYWQSFNEKPRAGIPEHIVKSDFEGGWPEATPPQRLRSILERWQRKDVEWWKAGAEGVKKSTVIPRSDSRQEWGQTMLSATKLIVEGFRAGVIRARLVEAGVEFGKSERSIALLERLCGVHKTGGGVGLEGLRHLQEVRTKGHVHRSGDGGRGVAADAKAKYGSYAAHFEWLCAEVAGELEQIEAALSE